MKKFRVQIGQQFESTHNHQIKCYLTIIIVQIVGTITTHTSGTYSRFKIQQKFSTLHNNPQPKKYAKPLFLLQNDHPGHNHS